MADRAKVIKALELEDKYPDTWECQKECPYYGQTDCTCWIQVIRDALELLKAQEPRVLTLDELRGIQEFIPCWHEYLDDDKCILEPAFVKFKNNFYHLLHDTTIPQMDERTYGVKWRIWTARPTDEQRKEVEWDG